MVTATDGREARAEIYKEAPDLILTDLQLPGMDGLELLEKVRGDLSTRHIPVIFLTAIDSKDAEMQAYNLGADDYVTKPFQAIKPQMNTDSHGWASNCCPDAGWWNAPLAGS